MDAIVEAALKKWPNVPHCHGWLGLDSRGDWYLRDEQAQAAGPFPQVKGSRIEHDGLRGFIARNYACDEAGCWFFQNGPQRVYVQLEAAPYVWRVAAAPPWAVTAHTGQPAGDVTSACVDEAGRLFLATRLGFGLVHTLDMDAAADAVTQGAWPAQPVRFAELPKRYGYVLAPAAPARAPAKRG